MDGAGVGGAGPTEVKGGRSARGYVTVTNAGGVMVHALDRRGARQNVSLLVSGKFCGRAGTALAKYQSMYRFAGPPAVQRGATNVPFTRSIKVTIGLPAPLADQLYKEF